MNMSCQAVRTGIDDKAAKAAVAADDFAMNQFPDGCAQVHWACGDRDRPFGQDKVVGT